MVNKNDNLTGNGILQISAYYNDVGRPSANTKIQVTEKNNATNIIEELTTDSSGITEEITLPSPPLDFSLENDRPQPYSEYNLLVTTEGYEDVIINGVQIFPNSTAFQDISLKQNNSNTIVKDTISINDHVLWGNYPEKIPEEPIKELPPSTGFIVLPKPVIPQYIVVHTGSPTNKAAKDYWIPFKDYIKNVASSEIYATWPTTTIKANVIAIISFTLNRVYTEWYRSKGYSFTLTNSTAFDQSFTYGRTFYKEISIVVDDIFTTFITKPQIRQPLFAQYCDGKKSKCPNWMTQWGSKDLGDKGYSTLEILKSFYGKDIYLMQAEKVQGVPSSYPGSVLKKGSSGQNVRIIQEQLNRISNNYPAIPKIKVDGIIGDQTITSVKIFQKVFRLPLNGVVDFATWYKISDIFVAVSKLAELV